ncbi:MAG: GumC domain-containing protein [Roseivivax sp.]
MQFQTPEEVFAALRRRAPAMAIVIVLGCVLSVLFALGQQKLYLATAVVQVEGARIQAAEDGADMGAESVRRIELIKQRMTASDTLLTIGDEIGMFTPDDPEAEPLNRSSKLAVMRASIEVSEVADDRIGQPRIAPFALIIEATTDDPERTAELANRVMMAGIDEARRQSLSRAADALAFFDEETARLEGAIAEAEAELAEFRREYDQSLPGAVSVLRGQRGALEETAFNIDRDIAELESTVTRQRDTVRDREISLLEEQKALIEARIAEIDAAIARAPEVARDLAVIERRISNLQEQYSTVVRQRADAELDQVLEAQDQSDRLTVLERAVPPDESFSRSRKSIALIGAVLSGALALGLAYALELFNPAIRSAAQLERRLGITPVISVPVVDRRRPGWGRRIGVLAGLAGLAAAVLAGLQFFGSRLSDPGFWGRFLPRRVWG